MAKLTLRWQILRFVFGILTATIVLTLVWSVLLIRIIVGDVQRVRLPWPLHPVVLHSPFSIRPGVAPKEVAQSIQLPVYPGAVGTQVSVVAWVSAAKAGTPRAKALVFLRLQVKSPVAHVANWYEGELGPTFVEKDVQPLVTDGALDDWISQMPVRTDARVLLSEEQDAQKIRGVILQPAAIAETASVLIFYYAEDAVGQ